MRVGPLHFSVRRLATDTAIAETDGRRVAATDDLVSPISVSAFTLWQETREGLGIPSVGSITPERLVAILPFVFLVDRVGDGGDVDFRYRLIGTDIVSHTAVDNTGRLLSDIADQGSQSILISLYAAVVASGEPTVQRIPYRSHLGSRFWYEALVMPLAAFPGGPVARLFGVAEHFSQAR